jgi:hypothetical protein
VQITTISDVKTNFLKGTFLIAVFFLVIAGCNQKSGNNNSDTSTVKENSIVSKKESKINTDSTTAPGRNTSPDKDKLLGRWVRSDGSYEIEIFSTAADGKIDAGYFNPNPINVDKAEWSIIEDKLFIRVILKDVNYPGSTYTLLFLPDKETLTGNYFQALEGVNYDVIFTRKR